MIFAFCDDAVLICSSQHCYCCTRVNSKCLVSVPAEGTRSRGRCGVVMFPPTTTPVLSALPCRYIGVERTPDPLLLEYRASFPTRDGFSVKVNAVVVIAGITGRLGRGSTRAGSRIQHPTATKTTTEATTPLKLGERTANGLLTSLRQVGGSAFGKRARKTIVGPRHLARCLRRMVSSRGCMLAPRIASSMCHIRPT